MINSDKLYIFDMIESIERIQHYLKNCSLEELYNDEMRQDAVVRRFEILGEAASKISAETKHKYPDIAWKEMKGTRNFLIHEYRKVTMKLLYQVSLDILPNELEKLKQIDIKHT